MQELKGGDIRGVLGGGRGEIWRRCEGQVHSRQKKVLQEIKDVITSTTLKLQPYCAYCNVLSWWWACN